MKQIPIRKELFWDVNIKNLDPGKHKHLIIERVLSYGNIEELKFILTHYKTSTIKEEIKKLGYLDPKTYNFVITYFNISKDELRCYTKRQSAKPHWN